MAWRRLSGDETAPAEGSKLNRLAKLLKPRSVALIGATDHSMWSQYTYQNLRALSPDVPVYCVHPRHDVVHGQPVHRSISAIGQPVDLAYVMVPTSQVIPVIEEAGSAGVRHADVLTAGFAEAGAEGRALEERLVALATRHDLILLGPNGNGFINATDQLAPYGLPIAAPLHAGPLGIVLQSGGLASVVLHMAQTRHIGISRLVATGNEAMVTATDVLAYLVDDPKTTAIAAFLESIRDPDRFRAVANAALDAGKPIVVLKVGRSAAGERAALAHTGAMVGDRAVVRAALRDLGVVQVDSLEDLLVTAGLLAYNRAPLGRRLVAVTASGGACDLIADRATDEGIELPEFPAATTRGLTELLPAFSSPRNPLDVTGYVVVDATISHRALEIVVDGAAGNYDTILYQATLPQNPPRDPTLALDRMKAVKAAAERSPVPVVIQTASSSDISPFARSVLDEVGVHATNGIEHGMTAIGRAIDWHERRRRLLGRPAITSPPPSERLEVQGAGDRVLSEAGARELLASGGVPCVPSRLVTTADAAVAAALLLGFPVVLKVATDVTPKTDLDGVLVSPMRRGGAELLVSVRRDLAWGPVLAVGLGGVWVEALNDTSLRLLPVGVDQVVEALNELRGVALLRGGRNRPPVSLTRVAEVVVAIASVAMGLGDALETLEVNPLWAAGDDVEVLDALVVLK